MKRYAVTVFLQHPDLDRPMPMEMFTTADCPDSAIESALEQARESRKLLRALGIEKGDEWKAEFTARSVQLVDEQYVITILRGVTQAMETVVDMIKDGKLPR